VWISVVAIVAVMVSITIPTHLLHMHCDTMNDQLMRHGDGSFAVAPPLWHCSLQALIPTFLLLLLLVAVVVVVLSLLLLLLLLLL
jgi:uncharacterized membrane protein YjgN (DUF898 family)